MFTTSFFLFSCALLALAKSEPLSISEEKCPLTDEEDYDNLCLLEPRLGHCLLVCRLENPEGGLDLVGQGSLCRDGHVHHDDADDDGVGDGDDSDDQGGETSYKTCFEGSWIPAGQRPVRRKRWWWGGHDDSEPTQYPPDITCPGDIAVVAPRGRKSATVRWRVPSASDRNGDTTTVSLSQGRRPGSSFSEGTTLIQYTARDSTGLTRSCSFTVRVSVTYCPDYQRRSFGSPGSQSCSGGEQSNIYGSVCHHTCPPGYTLGGASSSVLCQRNGRWNSAFPRCTIMSCGKPAGVEAGQVNCPSGQTYGQHCMLQCQPGYTPSGTAITTCNSAGLWSPSLQPCKDTEPPRFPQGCPADLSTFSGPLRSPLAVTWADPAVTDNGPDPVTLTYDPAKGSRLGVGRHRVTVTAADHAGNNASCTFLVNVEAKQCSPLTQPADGHVTCTSGHVEGSKCSFECNAGFRLQGHSSLTCMGTRLWDQAPPSCDAILCPAPPQVVNGFFLCPQGRQVPAECTLTCDPGYSRQVPATIRCLGNQTWTLHGTCRDTEPPQFTKSCPDDLHVFASKLGEDTHVTWSPPEASDSSGNVTYVTCDVASGASFPPGVTNVTCWASDLAGNSRSCEFAVNVSVLQCPDPGLAPNNQSRVLRYRCPDGYVRGASCTVECATGYSLLRGATVTCDQEAGTYPPLMKWTQREHNGTSLSTPECKVDHCPRLEPPTNGAVSCLLGPVAWDCFLQCNPGWDLSARDLRFDAHFFCNGQEGVWVPAVVPDCVVRRRPSEFHVYSNLFYLTEACNVSTSAIRRNFVTRLTHSILKDACAAVPTCTAGNVKVTCGPVTSWTRRKRTAEQGFKPRADRKENFGAQELGGRAVGGLTSSVVVSFHVSIPGGVNWNSSSWSERDVFRAAHQTKELLTHLLKVQVASGRLTVSQLRTSVPRVARPSLRLICPHGTLPRPQRLTDQRFACVGCPKGHHLPPGTSRCLPCPLGHFSPEDGATECTPCPPGTTTPQPGARTATLCQPAE
ncbi:uncharacterized protein LOC143301281 [Babylonia areolata]|uniref:uncharacterized protein LOC143301281 n=1 Tax=Babylonia areolata TaxID=304850 RepID=UPI003FCEF970